MGKVVHLGKIMEFAGKTPVFRARDVELIVKSKNYSHLILHKLVREDRIRRVTKGWYSLYEDPMVSVFCFKPAYIGLQDALSFHGLWEQETNVTIVTSRKVRVGVRRILDSNVVLHNIDRRYLFGFDFLKYGEFFVPVSDVEKTLLDLVYFNEIPSKDVLNEARHKLNEDKLKKYLASYPSRIKDRIRRVVL